MLHYPRLGITPPSTIFWGIYSASTTVSVVCCCWDGPHIFCLSFSPFPFISPLKLILLVEPALCWLKQDNFAYDYKHGLDMGLRVFVHVCVRFLPKSKTFNYCPLWKLHTRPFFMFIAYAVFSNCKTTVCGWGHKSQVLCGQVWKCFWQSGIESSTTM